MGMFLQDETMLYLNRHFSLLPCDFWDFLMNTAVEHCKVHRRRTMSGEDVLTSLEFLGFDNHIPILETLFRNFRHAHRLERRRKRTASEPHSYQHDDDVSDEEYEDSFHKTLHEEDEEEEDENDDEEEEEEEEEEEDMEDEEHQHRNRPTHRTRSSSSVRSTFGRKSNSLEERNRIESIDILDPSSRAGLVENPSSLRDLEHSFQNPNSYSISSNVSNVQLSRNRSSIPNPSSIIASLHSQR